MTSAGQPAPGRARRARLEVAVLAVLALVAIALGGFVGVAVVVVVAAVVLSGTRLDVLGGLGVALLVAAPLVVLVNGLPSDGEVSPGIVTETLVPHHLVFAGLALVCTWVIVDVGPRRVREPRNEASVDEAPPGGPLWVRRAVFATVVVAAVAATLGVLQA